MDLTLFGIDGMQALILTVFVAGFVEMVKSILSKDYKSSIIIATAGVSGLISGWILGINPLIGAVCGFAASGLITVMKNVGNNY